MIRKKKIIIISIIGIITTVAAILGNNLYNYFNNKYELKVMAYKPANEDTGTENLSSTMSNKNGYQIDKYENVDSAADWIDENEILTLTQKDSDANGNPSYYCSVYNLNTKESKDYKDVNMGEFLDISPNKQYVLYSEPRNIPKVGSEEWKKADESGDMYHRNVKMLNLTSGESSDIKTRRLNCNSEYKFISDDKILINNLKDWAIIDTTGKIYYEGTYNIGEDNAVWLSGFDELKDLGDKVEGKFYYTQDIKKSADGSIGAKVCSVDVNTKEIKSIYEGPYSLRADERGKVIAMDYSNNNGDAVDGVYKNRTFGYYILDESGKIIQNLEEKQGRNINEFKLTFDGSKAAYVEEPSAVRENLNDNDVFIKILDTKSGNVDEVADISNLKDKDEGSEYHKIKLKDKDGKEQEKQVKSHSVITNLCWDRTGTSLMFQYRYFSNKEQKEKINTYIVTFDK